jgi:hypothetical protein
MGPPHSSLNLTTKLLKSSACSKQCRVCNEGRLLGHSYQDVLEILSKSKMTITPKAHHMPIQPHPFGLWPHEEWGGSNYYALCELDAADQGLVPVCGQRSTHRSAKDARSESGPGRPDHWSAGDTGAANTTALSAANANLEF